MPSNPRNRTMPEFVPGVGFASGFGADRKDPKFKLSKSIAASATGLLVAVLGVFLVSLGLFFPVASSQAFFVSGVVIAALGFGAMIFGCTTADHGNRIKEHAYLKGVDCPCNAPEDSPFQRGYRSPSQPPSGEGSTVTTVSDQSTSGIGASANSTSGLGASDSPLPSPRARLDDLELLDASSSSSHGNEAGATGGAVEETTLRDTASSSALIFTI